MSQTVQSSGLPLRWPPAALQTAHSLEVKVLGLSSRP